MKYLKLYESFSIKFEGLINWDLINDAKEMALEYLDMGFGLYITVEYQGQEVYSMEFDHKSGVYEVKEDERVL